MYSRTTGALARPTPQLPDNRSTPLFSPFLSPLSKTPAKEKQQKHPSSPNHLWGWGGGAPATGWRQEPCAAHGEQVALGPSSITDQSKKREKERGGEGAVAEMLERERERGSESWAEKTNRTEAAVCVRSAGSFRMFSTAVLLSENLLEGYLLLALSFIISQEEPGHLVGRRSRG